MSDTNNTFDFSLYKNTLKDIKDELYVKIREAVRGKGIDFNTIKDLLGQADMVAFNVGEITEGLSDDTTYVDVKAEIDGAMQEIKGMINTGLDKVADKKEKSKLNRMIRENIDEGKTSKALDAFAELHKENGKLKRDDVEDRIEGAKTKYENIKKLLDQRKDYDNAIESYTKADSSKTKADAKTAIENEFAELKKKNEEWKKEVKKLKRINLYKYEDELEALINFAEDVQDKENVVTKELAQKFNSFRERVKDFSNSTISTYFDAINKKPDENNTKIDEIITILNNFRNEKKEELQNEPEMKEPEKVLEKVQNEYKKLVNGTKGNGVKLEYIFEAFPDIQDEILSKIEAGDTRKIDDILNKTENSLQKFTKKEAKDLMDEEKDALIKKLKYENEAKEKNEKFNPDAPKEEPQPPEDAVTNKLIFEGLLVDEKGQKKDHIIEMDGGLDGEKFDFTMVNNNEESKNSLVNEAYSKLCGNVAAHKALVGELLPTVPKKFDYRNLPIIHFLNGIYRKAKKLPPLKVEKTEKAIKDVLKHKIEERIEKANTATAQYTADKTAYNNNFELNKKEKDKFNREMAKIIEKYAKDGKNMKDEKIQNDMKEEAEDKVLGRDD